jgi:cytoskeletal protein RodZ
MARMPKEVPRRQRVPPRRTDADPEAEAEAAGRRAARQPPWADGEPGGSFGSWLRRQREIRQVSLRDVADRTKISLRYLQAMEDDRFDVLPAPVFAKGFLREYARYVGLSPDEVVNHYLSVQGPQEGEEEETGKARERKGPRSWAYGLFFVLALLLLLGLVWLFAHLVQRRAENPSAGQPPPIAAPPTVPAAVNAPPPPAEKPSAPLEVTLDFTQDCWVRAIVDGKERIEEQRVQGESLVIPARESVVFATLGNAGGVQIQVNGLPLELHFASGEVVHDLRIDAQTVQALKEKKEAH